MATTLYQLMKLYNKPPLTRENYCGLIDALKAEKKRVYGTTVITEEAH